MGKAVGGGVGVRVGALVGDVEGDALGDAEGDAMDLVLGEGGGVSTTRGDGDGRVTDTATALLEGDGDVAAPSARPVPQVPRNKTPATIDAPTKAPRRFASRSPIGNPSRTAKDTTNSPPAMAPGASRLP